MYFVVISPWKRAGTFVWTNLNSLYSRMLCVKFGGKLPSGPGEEDFLISSMYFRYFVIISLWKRAGSFVCINMNPHQPRMLYAKFGWYCPSGSWEEDENVKVHRQMDGRGRWIEGMSSSFHSLFMNRVEFQRRPQWIRVPTMTVCPKKM